MEMKEIWILINFIENIPLRKELEMEMYGEMNGVCKRLRNGKMLTDSILNCPCCENKHQENKL